MPLQPAETMVDGRAEEHPHGYDPGRSYPGTAIGADVLQQPRANDDTFPDQAEQAGGEQKHCFLGWDGYAGQVNARHQGNRQNG